METLIVSKKYDGAYWNVTFRYWPTGKCACIAKTAKRVFTQEPTTDDLVNSI